MLSTEDPLPHWLLHHEDLFGESLMEECCFHLCSSRPWTTFSVYFLHFSPWSWVFFFFLINILAVGVRGDVGEKKASLGRGCKASLLLSSIPLSFLPPHFPSLFFSCNKHLAVTSVVLDFVLLPGNLAVSRIHTLPLF